jgi:hypothetical protein
MNAKNDKPSRNRTQRRSYFGPILLISIGLVFLAKNLGIIPGEGWGTIWRLWPLLLIIGGLDDLVRREGVAWPILMIGIGVALLYNYFGPRSWISWTQVLQLWPILLIAVGIDVIFRGETGWRSLLGVILAVVLIGSAVFLAFQGADIQAEGLIIAEEFSSTVDEAELDLSLSVGEFLLDSESQTGMFISGNITPDTAIDDLDERGRSLSYQLESTKPSFFPYTAKWDLNLTSSLPLALLVNNSVGEMRLDLADLDLILVSSNQGVGRMVVALPDLIEEDVLLKQGVGVIEVEIPDNVRIAVDAMNGLSRVSFPDDFELEDGYYTSPGASRSNADLLIVVEQGVGLVTFQYGR